MIDIIKSITVDVSRQNTFQAIVAKQGDEETRFLRIALTNDGEVIKLNEEGENYTATINVERSDGGSDFFSCTIDGEGMIIAPLTAWMLELSGMIKCSISVTKNTKRLTSTSFSIYIEKTEMGGETIESAYAGAIPMMIRILELEPQRQALAQDMAELQTQLTTEFQMVVDKADESLSLARQVNKAKGFDNYAALVSDLSSSDKNAYPVGQSFLIRTLNVPDLWVYSVANNNSSYTFTTDQNLINVLQSDGTVQIGYYKVAMLETLKQDLTNYAIKSNVATTMTNPIENNTIYRLSNIVTSLTLNAPSLANILTGEFTSELMFTTGATINLTTNGITFKGRDCDQFGNFDIQPNTNYYISFMKFGSNLIGLVAKM